MKICASLVNFAPIQNGQGHIDGDGDLHDLSALIVSRGEVFFAASSDVGKDGGVLYGFKVQLILYSTSLGV